MAFIPYSPFCAGCSGPGIRSGNIINNSRRSKCSRRRPRAYSVRPYNFSRSLAYTTRAVFLPDPRPPEPEHEREPDAEVNSESESVSGSGTEWEHEDVENDVLHRLRKHGNSMSSVDAVLAGTAPSYSGTWAESAARRSVTSVGNGSREVRLVGSEELNEALKPGHLARHRHVLAPEEAFAAIFAWEALVGNARELELHAWNTVAKEEGLGEIDMEDLLRALNMPKELAVQRAFYWDLTEWSEVKRICRRQSEISLRMWDVDGEFEFIERTGVKKWIESLKQYGVKCVICAGNEHPRQRVMRVLSKLRLWEGNFSTQEVVSAEDEADTIEQMLLIASIKASRAPEKCVVFTDRPEGITAAHDVSSKAVALIHPHPAYELKAADETVMDYNELVMYNVRRLFAAEGSNVLRVQTMVEEEESRR